MILLQIMPAASELYHGDVLQLRRKILGIGRRDQYVLSDKPENTWVAGTIS
jgi:hypothetical protein